MLSALGLVLYEFDENKMCQVSLVVKYTFGILRGSLNRFSTKLRALEVRTASIKLALKRRVHSLGTAGMADILCFLFAHPIRESKGSYTQWSLFNTWLISVSQQKNYLKDSVYVNTRAVTVGMLGSGSTPRQIRFLLVTSKFRVVVSCSYNLSSRCLEFNTFLYLHRKMNGLKDAYNYFPLYTSIIYT